MSLQEFLSLPHLVDWHRELVTLLEGCRRPDFPRQLSATLKLIIDHENVILKVYQSDNDKPHLLYHDYPRALEPQYIDRYLSAAYLQDPVLYSIRSGSSTSILQINSQTCQLQGSEYFDMYYKELRLDDEIDVLLPIDNRCHLVLSIGRRGTPPLPRVSFRRCRTSIRYSYICWVIIGSTTLSSRSTSRAKWRWSMHCCTSETAC